MQANRALPQLRSWGHDFRDFRDVRGVRTVRRRTIDLAVHVAVDQSLRTARKVEHGPVWRWARRRCVRGRVGRRARVVALARPLTARIAVACGRKPRGERRLRARGRSRAADSRRRSWPARALLGYRAQSSARWRLRRAWWDPWHCVAVLEIRCGPYVGRHCGGGLSAVRLLRRSASLDDL